MGVCERFSLYSPGTHYAGLIGLKNVWNPPLSASPELGINACTIKHYITWLFIYQMFIMKSIHLLSHLNIVLRKRLFCIRTSQLVEIQLYSMRKEINHPKQRSIQKQKKKDEETCVPHVFIFCSLLLPTFFLLCFRIFLNLPVIFVITWLKTIKMYCSTLLLAPAQFL